MALNMAHLNFYISIADALARLFAPHAEIVLHDLSLGRIHHIAGCFSKRRAGDSSLTDIVDVDRAASIIGPYSKTNWDGRRIKSITVVLRGEAGDAIGLMCVNHDVEAFAGILEQLTHILGDAVPMQAATALFSSDWRERINEHVGAFLAAENATLAGLTTGRLNALIACLDKAALFEIRNATPYVAEILGMSRATLYNRLRLVRVLPVKKEPV